MTWLGWPGHLFRFEPVNGWEWRIWRQSGRPHIVARLRYCERSREWLLQSDLSGMHGRVAAWSEPPPDNLQALPSWLQKAAAAHLAAWALDALHASALDVLHDPEPRGSA
ncbi:MAG: hypothetical protein OXN97_06590 [Bryobacterales bacterium]|nr:hypothetical protein [Bryobacterales bacterium]MDE0629511.1 hypothetical protein [Bryobacterales bacterium]